MIDLKQYFHDKYQGGESFVENVILPIFGEDKYEDAYEEDVLEDNPELMTMADNIGITSLLRMGTIDIPMNPTDVFDITVSNHTMLSRNRVGIQQIIRRIMTTYSSAFMIFHYNDNECWDWRFTFCSKATNNDVTDNKRYTFMLGPNQSCRTVAENFDRLRQKSKNGSDIELNDIKTAFSVEALSDEFFGKYKQHYEDFVAYITGKRFVKVGGKWEEKTTGQPHQQMYADFGKDDKRVRDYVKKLLGRIVFLHFLQKKGWLGVPEGKQWGEGDQQFMKHLYEHSTDDQKKDFLDVVLEPLFTALDTDRAANGYLFDTHVALEHGNRVRVPYLNGGLFDRDSQDEIPTQFPEKLFNDLLEFLSEYNFTIDENDPDDAQVGVDPEMLGRIFENLLEDNKDKGAFYTPKEIVRYMCRQSLTAYLNTDINDPKQQKNIEEFVRTYDVVLLGGADSELAQTIDRLLKEVKICDPAIGSGAFPMGLLKELFLCRGAIENFDNAAEIKRHIIQQNIYGVDIEKGAVDIARLRFWLSLVVDETEPQTLPNLDFKIMQGNSLLESYLGEDLSKIAATKQERTEGLQMTFFDATLDMLRKQLNDKINQYYGEADHQKKAHLLTEINDNIKKQLKETSCRVDLSNINIQANDQFFLWHTWFADVFNRPSGCNGFDIVIGNPPYIDSETMTKNMPNLRSLYSKLYKCAKGNWDMFVIFIELAFRIVANNGIFSFIIPNKLIASKYAVELRKFLGNKNISEIRDYSRIDVFENAAVYPVTVIAKNTVPIKSDTTRFTIMDNLKITKQELSIFTNLLTSELYWDVFFQQKEVYEIMSKIENNGKLSELSEIYGAATVSEAYEIKEIIRETKNTNYEIKLINTGTIDPYISKWGIDNCSYIKEKYLKPVVFENQLKKISKIRLTQAKSSKIIIAGMSCKFEAFLDSDGEYLAGKSTTIVLTSSLEKLKFLVGIINSKVANFWLNTKFNSLKMAGGYLNVGTNELSLLPIPTATFAQQQKITTFVDKILLAKKQDSACDTTNLEREIDLLVYELYGLTEADIKIIEGK